jgi:hypothetical protein
VLASIKRDILPLTLFRKLVSAFQWPPGTVKIVVKASESRKRKYTGENRSMREKERWNINLMRHPENV